MAHCVFDWDDAKSKRNSDERGLPFDLAPAIFASDLIAWVDDRKEYGEFRIDVLGRIAGRVHFLTYTQRGEVTWIISFRKANRRETDAYQARFDQRRPEARRPS